MAAVQLSDGNPDGQTLGQSSTDKVAFFGKTPIVRPTVTLIATAATIATIRTRMQALQTALDSLGLVTK